MLHSLWGIICATFGKEKFDRVMLGHGDMTSQEVQGQAIFARNSGTGLIRRRYRGFLVKTNFMTPPPYPLTFWSRSGQSQGQGQVSDLG